LASCRAVLMALLLPDPCDEHCPAAFKEAARHILLAMHGHPRGWTAAVASDAGLRRSLLKFIADFADWDNAANPEYLTTSRALVKAAHGEEPPLVVDPFAGGGSIPLEALRVGCEAFASDLNPVACLILKVMLEDIPRHGPKLADELRKAGKEIKAAAERELADLYPKDADGATPIAYLWARTVRCEAPDCGAEIPLMRSFWLCKKEKRKRALKPSVVRRAGATPEVAFEVFEPTAEREVHGGTVNRAKATCLCCGTVLPPERVRLQLSEQRGGADAIFDEARKRIGGARMTAVVTLKPGETGRHYRLPTDTDYAAVRRAQLRLDGILRKWERGGRQGLCPVPDEPLPPIGTLGFRVQRYGMVQWGDLFTARQKTVLADLGALTSANGANIGSLLACAFSRVGMSNMSCTRWNAVAEKMQHTFGRQALPIVWDFAEVVVTANGPGNWQSGYELVGDVVEETRILGAANAHPADGTNSPLSDEAAQVWFTDPPYYDAIPYADLSDFFLVWLKHTLPDHPLLRDPFNPDNPLSPKAREAVQDETKTCEGRTKDRAFFEDIMGQAFAEGRRVLQETGVGSVVFAHKTTDGWEALLAGMIHGGWTITGSWPIATESRTRLRARDSAALATSVHLICRPRPEDAPIGEWADVLRELPKRVADWMRRLQGEGVRGADLVFACVGPALEIYSRYRAVETVDGRAVALAEYLERVWEVVGRTALREVLGTASGADAPLQDALEEDARLTALFLWTLQSTETTAPDDESDPDEEAVASVAAKGFSLPFDVVRRFSQPMGIDLEAWHGRIVAQAKGIMRLLPVAERAKGAVRRGRRIFRRGLDRERRQPRQPAIPVPRRRAAPRPQAPAQVHPERGRRTASPRRHHPRPPARRHAPASQRPRQRPAHPHRRRAGARPRLPAPSQRPHRPVPSRQPRETPAGCHAVGGAEVRVARDAGWPATAP